MIPSDGLSSSSGPGSDPAARPGRQALDLLARDLEGELSETIAGRYVVGERLGHGAHGTVHRAQDRLTGETVAIKLLPTLIETDLVRLRGEIAALRLLRLPGVAHLFDEGSHHGRPFLVMELVEGEPFPGALPAGVTRWTWESLRGPTLALLDTLAHVHAAGLVHRDLKPRNVLVTAAGRPVLLDFGLTVGRALADDSASDTRALGTPAYAAPEQCRGEPVDARADLYALGVMLWEALAGRRPHEASRVSDILRSRLEGPAESLRRVAPDVPRDVAELVDALLEVERERRPRSAVEVGEHLRGAPGRDSTWRLPFVGREAPLAALVDAALAGRSVRVVGCEGSGRTRLLQEAATRLAARGRQVLWAQQADRPFDSLSVLRSWLLSNEPATVAEACNATASALRRALSDGVVLVADDVQRLDSWSQEVLRRCARSGALLTAVATGCAEDVDTELRIQIGSLTERDLAQLFTGNDRLRHVHEDAASELALRTDSLPARIDDELFAWWTAGVVESSAAGLRVTRSAIDRLRGGLPVLPARAAAAPSRPIDDDIDELLAWCHLAWPNTTREILAGVTGRAAWLLDAELQELDRRGGVRILKDGRVRPLRPSRRLAEQSWISEVRLRAHSLLADRIAAGAMGRLYHLIAAGRHGEAAREAGLAAREHRVVGRLSDAEAALTEGLRAARRAPAAEAAELEREIFAEWLAVAISAVTSASSDRLLYEMSRSSHRGAAFVHIEQLARAALAGYESGGLRALSAIEAVEPFTDPELETWRQGLRVRAARHCGLAEHERVVGEARVWAGGGAGDLAQGSLQEWEGLLLYRQERYREAADRHIVAASRARRPTGRLSALLNAASALLELPALEECENLAAKAQDLARDCRHPLFEGRSTWLVRSAAYRRCQPLEPDVELVDALESIGMLEQAALAALNEAAVAWRRGELPLAGELAERAARDWIGVGKRDGLLLARSLAAAAGRLGASEVAPLREMALQAALPRVAAQALGLLAQVGVAPGPEATPIIREAAWRGRRYGWDLRFEVLSLDEIVSACGLSRLAVEPRDAG